MRRVYPSCGLVGKVGLVAHALSEDGDTLSPAPAQAIMKVMRVISKRHIQGEDEYSGRYILAT